MSTERASGLGVTFLVGGVIALLVASLIIGFVPMVKCPACLGLHEALIGVGGSWPIRCAYCDERKVVSVLKKWTFHQNTPAR